MDFPTKLELRGDRVEVPASEARSTIIDIFNRLGCDDEISQAITDHLIEANLCGVESHGVMRVMQYAERMRSGAMKTAIRPEVRATKTGATIVDGGMGSGIPAMLLAYETVAAQAQDAGLAALSIINTGHTGRHGAYADSAAAQGLLTILSLIHI